MLLAQASGEAVNLTAIIVATIGAIGAVLSFIQANRVRRDQRGLESKRVDAEAYERARQFDKEVVERLQAEIGRLQERLREEQESADELRRQLAGLDELQREAAQLRQALEDEQTTTQGLREKIIDLETRIADLQARLVEYDARRSGGE